MSGGSSAAAGVALALAACLSGCALPPCPQTIVPLEQIVADYNANAAAVSRLWARAKLAVTVDTGKGFQYTWGTTDPRSAYRNGLLLLEKGPLPLKANDFVLIGRETAAVELFRMGTSLADDVYYTWYNFGEHSGAVFGRNELAGAPCAGELAVEPQQLLSLLGAIPLPHDLTQLPAVTVAMQKAQRHGLFRTSPCAYVVGFVDRQAMSGRILLKRHIYFAWSDDQPPRPFRVDFIAPDGRCVLTASLKDYQPIADTSTPAGPAMMPTDIEISAVDWPGRESPIRRIHMVLSEMTAGKSLDYAGAAEFWSHLPMPEEKAVQIDRRCQPGGSGQ